ncbi:MAG: HAMP domain-containing histidine kinase [Candidatus Obscuribacter sp.]|nr:HAMP domain-containing histidine kinase [Candidatus Obscuribacter sp.]
MFSLLKQSIFAQGGLIVFISIAMQAVFFFCYSNLIDQSSALAHRESISKATIGRINWLSSLYLFSLCSRTYSWLVDEPLTAKTVNYVNYQIKDQHDELALLLADNSKELEGLKRLFDQYERISNEIDDLTATRSYAPTVAPSTLPRLNALKLAVNSAARERSEFLALISKKYPLRANWLPKAQAAHRDWLLVGFLANVGCTILVFVVFFFGVAKRLHAVKSKISDYRAGSTFVAPKDGLDEIALIEQSLYVMAQELAERDRRKQELMSMVTHDLRSPFTTIAGMVRLLEAGVVDGSSDKQHASLQRVSRNVNVLLRLVNDLLDMDKLEAGMIKLERQLVPLSESVQEAFNMLRDLAEQKRISLLWLGPELFVNADSGRLLQILVNLIANAIKYSSNEGSIEISAQENPAAGAVVVRIRDHGRGIPDSMKASIFERFQQVEQGDSRTGNGLGLAICHTLVKLHGGRIWVEDAEGGGSCFCFELLA